MSTITVLVNYPFQDQIQMIIERGLGEGDVVLLPRTRRSSVDEYQPLKEKKIDVHGWEPAEAASFYVAGSRDRADQITVESLEQELTAALNDQRCVVLVLDKWKEDFPLAVKVNSLLGRIPHQKFTR